MFVNNINMSVNNMSLNLNINTQHFTPPTIKAPPKSLSNIIIDKKTNKKLKLNNLNRKKFKANPTKYIQPSNKFYDKFSGRFKLRNEKNSKIYEKKLDNELHLYSVKLSKFKVNKKHNNYIIPSGFTTENVSVYSTRKDLKENILAKRDELNNELDLDPNDPYQTRYEIEEIFESEIKGIMETQQFLKKNEFDFLGDSEDEDNINSNFDDDAYDMFNLDVKYDNKWFDYDFEKDDDRCVWNYLQYFHNITPHYITETTEKRWNDNEGLTLNDIYKIAQRRGTPLIVLDLCYNIMKDNKGKLMKYIPKEEDRRHSKYFVFIKANHHLYPFTTKTQRTIINKKLSVNKSFMERNSRGKSIDEKTKTIAEELNKSMMKDGTPDPYWIILNNKQHHIISKKDFNIEKLINSVNTNTYINDATDLNDIYVELYNKLGVCFKYTANNGLITSIISNHQDKEEVNGMVIDNIKGNGTEHYFKLYCNTNATITKEICKKNDLFFNNDSLSGIGKRIYNIDKKFKHLCSDYLEAPFKIKKPLNKNGNYDINLNYKGYDINKCYSSLLENPLFNDGFEKFEVFDNIEKYDGEKKINGWFYVELKTEYKNNLLMDLGGEWSSYSLLCEMDKRKFKYVITHQYYPHKNNILKKNHFKDFVKNNYEKSGNDAKHIINSFVGHLGKHKQKKRCVKSIMVNNIDDISYYTKIYNNLDVIQIGELYMLNFFKIEDNRSNGLPIHNKIIEMGRLKLQLLFEELGGNMDNVLLIKTDMIVYGSTNKKTIIKLGNDRGEIKLENLNYDKDKEPIFEINEKNYNYFKTTDKSCTEEMNQNLLEGSSINNKINNNLCLKEKREKQIGEKYINDFRIYKNEVFNLWCEENNKPEWIRLQGNTGLSFMKYFDKDNKEFKKCKLYKDYPDKKYYTYEEEVPINNNYYEIYNGLDLLCKKFKNQNKEVEIFNSKYLNVKWNNMDGNTHHNCYDKLIKNGGFLTGYAGSGKSHQTTKLYKQMEKDGLKPLLCATTNKAKANEQFIKNNIETSTIHSVLGHLNPMNFDKMYKWALDITHLLIDECSMIDKGIYYHLRNIKVLYPHLKIIFIGDYQQLPAVDFGAIYHNLEETHFLKFLMNNNYVRLNKCMRTLKDGKPDEKMWNICKSILDDSLKDKDIKFIIDKSKDNETLINLCWTNKKKNLLNGKSVFNYFRKKVKADPKKQILSTNKNFCSDKEDNKYFKDKKRFFWCAGENYNGTYMVATKNNHNYYNNQTFFISKFDGEKIILKDSVLDDCYITIDKKDFLKDFDYSYCMTAHRSQGSTINCAYTIHEWEKIKFDKSFRNWRYVVLSRTSNLDKVYIKPY